MKIIIFFTREAEDIVFWQIGYPFSNQGWGAHYAHHLGGSPQFFRTLLHLDEHNLPPVWDNVTKSAKIWLGLASPHVHVHSGGPKVRPFLGKNKIAICF